MGILSFFKKLFSKRPTANGDSQDEEIHLEPKYWQEVIDFINTVNNLIKIHTIEDPNIEHVNTRIVDYIVEQINLKGSIKDAEQRYLALNTLADRILSNNLN